MSKIVDTLTFTGPIPPKGRYRAEELCKRQATQKKGEQIRLNTLAVSFVNSYLQYMGFETDLDKSNSWNPVQQTLMDVADLSLKNLGLLECRPVFEEIQSVYVPPEVQSNRIGYVAVEISKSFREATLLGFVREIQTDLLLINQLQPLDVLLEYLEELSQLKVAEIVDNSLSLNKTLVKLKQWFENIFDADWQQVETLLGVKSFNPAWNTRSVNDAFISRGKLIDLGKALSDCPTGSAKGDGETPTFSSPSPIGDAARTETLARTKRYAVSEAMPVRVASPLGEGLYGDRAVVLVVTLPPDNEQEMDIIVEIHPTNGQHYLPPNLHLMVLDFEGASVMEAQTRSSNKNIQLEFSCELGERFSVKLALGDISITENFVIC